MKKKRKLNYKKVFIGYLLIFLIGFGILPLIPDDIFYTWIWAFGFIGAVFLFTGLIEGGDK